MSKPDLASLISPENHLDITQFNIGDKAEMRPVIEISKDTTILYVYAVDLDFVGVNTNILASIVYNKKAKTIEMRGRTRFDSTGNKKVFSGEIKPYTTMNLIQMRKKIKDLPIKLTTNVPQLKIVGTPVELHFTKDESIESIVKKMNDSNAFNIGSIPTT